MKRQGHSFLVSADPLKENKVAGSKKTNQITISDVAQNERCKPGITLARSPPTVHSLSWAIDSTHSTKFCSAFCASDSICVTLSPGLCLAFFFQVLRSAYTCRHFMQVSVKPKIRRKAGSLSLTNITMQLSINFTSNLLWNIRYSK